MHKYTLKSSSGNTNNRFGYIEGIKKRIERLYNETSSQMMRDFYGYYMGEVECPKCNGDRLNELALCVKIGKYNRSAWKTFFDDLGIVLEAKNKLYELYKSTNNKEKLQKILRSIFLSMRTFNIELYNEYKSYFLTHKYP